MALFFPEWIPWWLQLIIVATILIFGIFFLFMPFAVFGVKGRLSYLENQLEDVQAQLRILLKRTADVKERSDFKIQPVQVPQADNSYDAIETTKGERNQQAANTYSSIPRPRQTRFDPPKTEQGSRPVTATKEQYANVIDQQDSYHFDNYSTRERTSRSKVVTTKREEQLYDPPVASQKDEAIKDGSKRRAEPILRWPPR